MSCNLPVTGGSSLCSMMWIREHQGEIWAKTCKFGHTNTYLVKRLTGHWVVDPSTASITGLYDTRRNNLSWNHHVLERAGISCDKLPELRHSHEVAGTVLPEVAARLGISRECEVLCGGNDAVLAALSAGLREPGQIVDVAGTCEIVSVCLSQPIASPNFNVRCHVLPNRWLSFFVLNTGGKALEWFHGEFCREMDADTFYGRYVPGVIEEFLASGEIEQIERDLPRYEPFLQGSRYSLETLTAGFTNMTLETTRERLLMGLLKGNLQYLGGHLKEVAAYVPLRRTISTTGGGAKIRGMDRLKKRWMGDFDYHYQDQSSLLGAAMLGRLHQTHAIDRKTEEVHV
jgi:sugar (pentulose or hexulose) kinase